MKKNYQICTNCVMDITDTKITFDKNGVCDHCNNFYKNILPNWHTDKEGWQSLQKIAKKIKKNGQGKEFDCMVGMSGGVDSSYLLYVAKEKLGLRPLVFTVDTGWNTQLAVNNIKKLVNKLNLNLHTEIIDWEEMRDLQLAFFKASVPHIDWPQDHAIFASIYNFAAKHKIKYILTGANYSTECIKNPMEWTYMGSDLRQLKDIHNKFGQKPLIKYPTTNILKHKVYLRYFKGIKVIKPLNYIPYIKEDAIKILVDKFGWEKYPQKHFESKFTKFYEGYWLPKKFGYDTRKVQFSSLIVTKQMTRKEALKKLLQPSYNKNTITQDFEYIATKLGISANELQGYMVLPNKSYKNYKSQLNLFILGTKLMKLFGLERRTIR